MRVEITKNQRDLVSQASGRVSAALEKLKAAQTVYHFSQENYDQANASMRSLLSCFALDGGATPQTEFGASSIVEEHGKIFLVLEEVPTKSA